MNTIGYKTEEERQIVAEIYKTFATDFDGNGFPIAYQQWFRGAGFVDNHPVKMTKTLQINCNFKPLLILKDIMGIETKYGYPVFLQEVDKDGTPIKE
jgi:hypothetical protein